MKFKILLLSLTLFAFSASFASPVDSVGVKNNNGKKMILFKVKAGDTYYSIGRRYNVKAETLMKFNGAKKQTLTIGKIINVPTDIPFKSVKKKKEAVVKKEVKKQKTSGEERSKEEETDSRTEQIAGEAAQVQAAVQQEVPATQYKVSAGETLYSIARRFNTTVDQLTKLNNLTTTNLQPGQILLVVPASTPAPPQPQPEQSQSDQIQPVMVHPDTQRMVAKRDSTMVAVIAKDSLEHRLPANKFGIYEKNEKGVATWIDDPSLDPNKKLVLHRTAPIGTVIKITNPMTNRTTFAKVVGRFTDTEATKDVIIVMTKNVADSLGALDKRFHVNISYGSPNE
ncbi:MAG TPA: LysM peptidoglycan-binding domain-containing protein [Mucilaginibacter sp.]|nr:LysM peptidoglycan-binding domain-containing protein [Mucilaginibacter sp.]